MKSELDPKRAYHIYRIALLDSRSVTCLSELELETFTQSLQSEPSKFHRVENFQDIYMIDPKKIVAVEYVGPRGKPE